MTGYALLVLITMSGIERHPVSNLAMCERIVADYRLTDLGAFCIQRRKP